MELDSWLCKHVQCHNTQRPSGIGQTDMQTLLPQLLEGHVFIAILLHDLSDCHFEIFLSDMYSPFPQRKHACLSAAGFQLCS